MVVRGIVDHKRRQYGNTEAVKLQMLEGVSVWCRNSEDYGVCIGQDQAGVLAVFPGQRSTSTCSTQHNHKSLAKKRKWEASRLSVEGELPDCKGGKRRGHVYW